MGIPHREKLIQLYGVDVAAEYARALDTVAHLHTPTRGLPRLHSVRQSHQWGSRGVNWHFGNLVGLTLHPQSLTDAKLAVLIAHEIAHGLLPIGVGHKRPWREMFVKVLNLAYDAHVEWPRGTRRILPYADAHIEFEEFLTSLGFRFDSSEKGYQYGLTSV